IRDGHVTGVQTCALPILVSSYGGRTLYTVNNAGLTILTARTAVAGTESGIRRAIDRIQDGRVARDQPKWMLDTLETPNAAFAVRSEERRVGKECGSRART